LEVSCYYWRVLPTSSIKEGKERNKNYFDENAVPDPMIKTVRPLMTVIGGHIRCLDPGLAGDFNTLPVGIHPERLVRQINQWEAGIDDRGQGGSED
jgi:hypothetical protein